MSFSLNGWVYSARITSPYSGSVALATPEPAPQILFDLFGGAIGLLLVGALLDPQTAIGITGGLAIFVVTLRYVGARIVLTDMGIDVGDIESHYLTHVGDFALERLQGLGEHISKHARVAEPELLIEPAHAGQGAFYIKAVGVGDIQDGTKAQVEREQGM